jgi:Tn3 transposase DDE domain
LCALEGLRDALRRRDVYVTPSERYADARVSLLGDAAWDASREETRRSLSPPAHPGMFLEQLGGELDDVYQRTRDGLTPEHPIHELAAGGLRVELDALPEPATLTILRERVDALLPAADLPDLVLEIAAKTEFIDAFTNDQESAPSSTGSRRACARSSSRRPATSATSRRRREQPRAARSQVALRRPALPTPETLAAANARIVDVHAKLPLAARWGGGAVASIDGLRFVVPRRTSHAA